MNKKIVIGVISISFILLIFSIILYAQKTHELRKVDPLELESMSQSEIIQYIYEKQSENKMPLYYLIPIFAFFGLVVGATIYHIMSSDIEKKEKTIQKNNQIILKLLTGEERNVVNTLVEQGGKVRQYELSHLPNLNKVKTHRIILKLEQKGIIEKQRLGKINNIVLDKELYEFLKK
ncbi:MAG: hypothetical protein QXK76_03590 [Candidatus Woesearchaeota archaeon]